MKNLILYIGGACLDNPGHGGWVFVVVRRGKACRRSGASPEATTTGNRIEMVAAIEGLRLLEPHAPLAVRLRSDSRYLLDGMSMWMEGWSLKGWRASKRLERHNARRRC